MVTVDLQSELGDSLPGHRGLYYMRYHIFEINPFQQLTLLESVDNYRAAKTRVSELRKSPARVAGTSYRMMFAADPLRAEQLLKEKREPRPMGEHD